jgi:hypothetical protein
MRAEVRIAKTGWRPMSTKTNPRESVALSALRKNHDPATPQRNTVATNERM